MKSFFSFLIFISISAMLNASELDLVRKGFYRASMEREVCEEIYNRIKDKNYEKKPLLMGYQGVYQAIMAKYLWNPISKWWYFQSGVDNLEKAIQQDRYNIELIFLRFSVQTNCPSFLGYDENIKADKAFIMKEIMDKNVRLKYRSFMKDIVNYMLGSTVITAEEKAVLKEIRDRELST